MPDNEGNNMDSPIVTVTGRERGPFGFHGVGKDAPTETTKTGGKQSVSLARMDLLPANASYDVGIVLSRGAEKYGVDNWKSIPTEAHLNKVLIHVFAWLAGDKQDNHLGHAACRALMAHQLDLEAGGMSELTVPEGNT